MLLPERTPGGWQDLRAALPKERWYEAARLIVARHGLPESEPTLYPTGSDVVMRVGEVVVKLSEPRWAEQIAMEAAFLARAEGRLPVRTPALLATDALEGWPYVVMSRVEGTPLEAVWPTLDAADRARLARDMGALLGALRVLPVEEEAAASWEPFLARMRAEVMERLSSRRQPAPEAWLARIVPFLDETPLRPLPLAWMHTELMGDHLLLSQPRGRWELSAMLDFADGRVGHPFYELPAMVEFVFRGERPLLREALLGAGLSEGDLDPALSRELCCWSLLHQFGSVARLLAACPGAPPSSFAELSERLFPL